MCLVKTRSAPSLTTPQLYTDGYTLIYPHNQNRAMLLNACGEVVHDWTIGAVTRRPGNTSYLQPNGDIIMTSRPACGWRGRHLGRWRWCHALSAATWDNDVLWSFTANNDSVRLAPRHHRHT